MAYKDAATRNAAQRARRAADPDKVLAYKRKNYAARTVEQKTERNAKDREYYATRKASGWTPTKYPRPPTCPTKTYAYNVGKYGLTPADVAAMHAEQDGLCAVCADAIAPHGASKHTHIDHCHSTGKVRGLLCHHCNIALGAAKDSIVRLAKMAAYLERNGHG